MKKSNRKKMFFHSIAALIIIYFIYHSIFGNRGLIMLVSLNNQLSQKKISLYTKKEQKDKLQQQVNLLYDDNLDLDLLDELARKAFAILKKNEKLLILKKKSKL